MNKSTQPVFSLNELLFEPLFHMVNFGIFILILSFFTTVPPVVFPLWHYTSFPVKIEHLKKKPSALADLLLG